MKDLMHHHPDADVRKAVVALCDALTRYERSTGRNYLIILKGDCPRGPYEYRTLSGGPASHIQTDEALLEAFGSLAKG